MYFHIRKSSPESNSRPSSCSTTQGSPQKKLQAYCPGPGPPTSHPCRWGLEPTLPTAVRAPARSHHLLGVSEAPLASDPPLVLVGKGTAMKLQPRPSPGTSPSQPAVPQAAAHSGFSNSYWPCPSRSPAFAQGSYPLFCPSHRDGLGGRGP